MLCFAEYYAVVRLLYYYVLQVLYVRTVPGTRVLIAFNGNIMFTATCGKLTFV